MSPEITEKIIARQPPEAQAIIRALLADNADLKARIEALERQAKGKTPQNSSLPPSSQHPHARPQPPKRRSKKKRGGQPGHEKHERPLIPTDQCSDVLTLKPTECRRCGAKLAGNDPDPLRHQVWELPKIEPIVTKYRRHRLACPHCGETTCAELPDGVPRGQSGPQLMALTALLMAFYRQSKRRTAEFLATLLGQCGRAVVASCGDLAEAVVWIAERGGQSLCRDDVDGNRNLPSTASQCLCTHHCRCRIASRPSTRPFITTQGVNDYGV